MKSKTEEKLVYVKNMTGKTITLVITERSEKTPLVQMYEQLIAMAEISPDSNYNFIMNGIVLNESVSFERILSEHEKSQRDHISLLIRLSRGSRHQISNANQNNPTFDSEVASLYLQMVDACDASSIEFEEEAAKTFLSTLLTLLYNNTERNEFLLGNRGYLFPDKNLASLIRNFLLEHPNFSITQEVALSQKKMIREDFPKYLDGLIRKTINSVQPDTSNSYKKTLSALAPKKEQEKEKGKEKESVISTSIKELEKKLTKTELTEEEIRETPITEREGFISLRTPMNEIIPGIYLGNEVAHNKLIGLIQTNASTFSFNLDCRYDQTDIAATKGYFHIPLSDKPDVVIKPETFLLGIDVIEEGLKTGNVLINCQGGSARSVSMVVAYLIKHYDSETIQNSTPQELVDRALAFIKEKRPCAYTGHQNKALTLFAETIKGIEDKKSKQAKASLFIAELKTLIEPDADGSLSRRSSDTEIAQPVKRLISALDDRFLNGEGEKEETEELTHSDVVDLLENPKSNKIIQFFADLFQKVVDKLFNFSIKK